MQLLGGKMQEAPQKVSWKDLSLGWKSHVLILAFVIFIGITSGWLNALLLAIVIEAGIPLACYKQIAFSNLPNPTSSSLVDDIDRSRLRLKLYQTFTIETELDHAQSEHLAYLTTETVLSDLKARGKIQLKSTGIR